MKTFKHGLMVARLQPLHLGHIRVINRMLEQCDNVTIVLGSVQEARTDKNPFTHFERRRMLGNVFPGQLQVIGIEDIHRPDVWAAYVIGRIAIQFSNLPTPDVYYAGDTQDSDLFGQYISTMTIGRDDLSGTSIRDMIMNNSDEWRKYVPPINHPMIENYLAARKVNNELV